jgi:hypothetical protein
MPDRPVRVSEAADRVGIWAPNCAEWVLVQHPDILDVQVVDRLTGTR